MRDKPTTFSIKSPEPFKNTVAMTVREVRLAKLLEQAYPYIVNIELSTKTSPTLRKLIDEIKQEIE